MMMNGMMECGSAMMWGMGIFGGVAAIALIFLVAVLIKYLFFHDRGRTAGG